MLKIRLSRTGKKSQPAFRILVQEHTDAVKSGKFVEILGHYLPTMNPKEFKVDHDRVKYWISVGAKPTDSVAALLKKDGMDGMDKYLDPRDKKRKKKKEEEEKPAPAAPAAAPAAEGEGDAPAAEAEAPAEAAPAENTPAEEAAPEEPAEKPAEDAKPEEADKPTDGDDKKDDDSASDEEKKES